MSPAVSWLLVGGIVVSVAVIARGRYVANLRRWDEMRRRAARIEPMPGRVRIRQ